MHNLLLLYLDLFCLLLHLLRIFLTEEFFKFAGIHICRTSPYSSALNSLAQDLPMNALVLVRFWHHSCRHLGTRRRGWRRRSFPATRRGRRGRRRGRGRRTLDTRRWWRRRRRRRRWRCSFWRRRRGRGRRFRWCRCWFFLFLNRLLHRACACGASVTDALRIFQGDKNHALRNSSDHRAIASALLLGRFPRTARIGCGGNILEVRTHQALLFLGGFLCCYDMNAS